MSSAVPAGWELKSVGDLSHVKRGASPRPIKDKKWWGGNVGWMRISDVTASKKYLTKTTQYLSDEGVEKSVRIKKGEVVLSICATIGRPIIVYTDACIHDGFVWFDELSDNVSREYWYYFLASKEEYLGAQRQSGTQGNLNTSIVSDLLCPLPPLPEQKRIASILTSVDEVIGKTESQINKLQDLKKGMMQELLTNGIGHTDFKDSPVGRIPKEWKIFTLGELANFINGQSFKASEWCDEGLPIIRIQNLNREGGFNYYSGQVDEKWFVPTGTLLFAWSGQRGKSFGARIWKGPSGVLNQHIFKVQNDSTIVSKRFLLLKMIQVQISIESKAHGFKDSFMHVKKADLVEEIVQIPSKEEQEKIVSIMGSVGKREVLLTKKLADSKKLKKALMQDLLTGKVRVKVN